jgi:FAD/FMN-containing dehydrogenase
MTSGQLSDPLALGEATVQELRDELGGELVAPGEPVYDEARSVWNGMIDRLPALIAHCTGTSDVIAAIRFARSEGLSAAVRGGAHNAAGNATCDGGYVEELSDDAIEAILAHAGGVPAPLGQLQVHQLGGATSRVAPGATAYGNRGAGFPMNYIGLWLDPAEDEANVGWVRAASDAMEPYGTGARYVNFLADEGEADVRSAYESETFTRLQNLKARYDPTNFFRLNQNIKPAQ